MNKRNIKAQFPFLTKGDINYFFKFEKENYKTERGFLNLLKRKNDKNRTKAEKPDATSMRIQIEWKKSDVWGYNPHAKAVVWYADGEWDIATAKCSGCGYDKESTVVADLCNELLCGMLWRHRHSKKRAPYGVSFGDCFPHFNGAVGIECYYNIATFLGGKMQRTASSDTFTQYDIVFKKRK